MNQRDLVWISFPYTDFSGVKIRPALIVSNNSYNVAGNDLVVCAVTSNLNKGEYKVPITHGDLVDGKLAVPSMVKADKIIQASKKLVLKKIAQLSNAKFAQVRSRIQHLVSDEAK